ncbi:hypothetical protein C0Q70_01163 [Pomacea canaliculata]|uniref:C2H2-type domain-containing protein n=1 Tax=Pomacea canaliculata TaxID=400727 RepID=A0A2T7PYS4_POMCA|nr:hypothetical protein C0Q70_01163 [Pomacea canaliculata]
MEKENDSPTTDSIALLEAQGIPTDDEDDDDIHFCKKCKQVFNKIEAYLEHKVKHENFKVTYNRSSGDRRMVLPMLVKKEQPETAHSMGDKAHNRQNNVHLEDESGTGQKKRRRRKKKMSHLDVQLIAEKSTYICNKCDRERPYSCEACGRKFAESGALTRHMRARNPCISKTDADLPRYGKKWSYVPNIPAVVGSGDGVTDEFLPVVPGDTVTLVQEGEDGEQIITQAQIISSSEDVGAFEMEMEEGEIKESEVEDTTADFENLALTQCRVCKEECVELEALRIHLRTHLADLNFRCSLCHFVAETREELQTHLQSKHLSQIKGIDANSLLPSHGTSVENSRHDITPKNEREAQIAVKQLLELAQDTGPDIQVHESLSVRAICRCPVCNRAFRGASYMRQHMKSHTGDRPHICSICPKSFTTKDALNKHLVVHTDDRNFKCGVCGKLFKRIGHVKEHLKIHNSDRPFACTFCDKAFKTHENVRFTVHRCGRGFAEHGTLNRHLKAKVPCQRQAGLTHLQVEDSEAKQAQHDSDIPTVLAEFSSVVADTQQYIVTNEISEEDHQTTEYVVLAADEIQNVEIVTEGDIDPAAILDTMVDGENSYVVVREPGNNLRIIDSSTGLTIATMPADSDSMHAVAYMSATEVETGSVMVQTESDSVSLVSDHHDGAAPLHTALLVDTEAIVKKEAETIQTHSHIMTLESQTIGESPDLVESQAQEIVVESHISDTADPTSSTPASSSSQITALSLPS